MEVSPSDKRLWPLALHNDLEGGCGYGQQHCCVQRKFRLAKETKLLLFNELLFDIANGKELRDGNL